VLEIHIEETDNYTLCRPSGEIDAYTVGSFREALTNLAESERLLIDLSDVPFMDSAGLGALIGGIRKVREAEGAVAVSCDRPALIRLLHTTGFDRIVPVTESLEDGVEALDEQQGAED
jgi:anti-sigma B factor antagonist